MKQHLAPYKYPRTVEIVPELPKTATGKIQRFRLRAPATGEAGREVTSMPTIRCDTDPARYRHWRLSVEGASRPSRWTSPRTAALCRAIN